MISKLLDISYKKNLNQSLIMSSELHKYIETAINKKENLLNAEIINFPNEKKLNDSKDFKINERDLWSIRDESNVDQLKAVTGICFMLGTLTILGLYSNLL